MHWDIVFLAYPCYTLVLTGDFLNGCKRGQHLRKTQNCHLLLVPNVGPLLQATEFNNDSAVPPLLIYGLLFREFLKKNKQILDGIHVLKRMNWIKTSTPVLKKLNIIALTYTNTEKSPLLCFDSKVYPFVLELDGVCLFLPMLKLLIFWAKKQLWNKKRNLQVFQHWAVPAHWDFCVDQ